MTRIEAKDKPASYLLDSTGGVIDIFVHTSVAPQKKDFNLETLNGTRRGYSQIPDVFTPPSSEKEWGYGKVLSEYPGFNPDWIKLVCALPNFTDEGTDWDGIVNTVGTLRVLFDYFNFTDNQSTADIPQLLSATMIQGRRGEMGWPISVDVRPALSRFIQESIEKDQFSDLQRETDQAMYGAYTKMIRVGKSPREFRLEGSLSPSYGISLHCSEIQTATLYFGNHGPIDNSFELMPQNVDTPQQQLTLLAGISRLCGLAIPQNMSIPSGAKTSS